MDWSEMVLEAAVFCEDQMLLSLKEGRERRVVGDWLSLRLYYRLLVLTAGLRGPVWGFLLFSPRLFYATRLWSPLVALDIVIGSIRPLFKSQLHLSLGVGRRNDESWRNIAYDGSVWPWILVLAAHPTLLVTPFSRGDGDGTVHPQRTPAAKGRVLLHRGYP
jgi:hypothetical protein